MIPCLYPLGGEQVEVLVGQLSSHAHPGSVTHQRGCQVPSVSNLGDRVKHWQKRGEGITKIDLGQLESILWE